MGITPTELVEELHQIGAVVSSTGITAPKRAWRPELREATSHYKDLLKLLYGLRLGQSWLTEEHGRWCADDPRAASDAHFSRFLDEWDGLDNQLRTQYRYKGCIHGHEGRCPESSPANCRACAR